MMRGHEKSDCVIVAAKPANKAEQSAAEPVEPRAGTKGNASQQSTCRTQSRVSVSQALEHIRRIARERKKERFTALFHHLNIDLLEEAFFEPQGRRSTRRGSADMDGLCGRPQAHARESSWPRP